jgi:uncharacterized UPF0160 family protein
LVLNTYNTIKLEKEVKIKEIDKDIIMIDEILFRNFDLSAFYKRRQNELTHTKLCVFGHGNDWKVQTLPENLENRFSMKCPAPEKWRGLIGYSLRNKCGINNATFIHISGFIGGTTTADAAVQLARAWIAG